MRREIIDYIEKAGLSSNILVYADFPYLKGRPRWSGYGYDEVSSSKLLVIVGVTFSVTSYIIARKCNVPSSVHAVTLLPASCSILNLFKKVLFTRRMHKQIDEYIAAMLKYSTLNHGLVEYLQDRSQINPDLNNETVARYAANAILNICNELHKQLLIHKHYTLLPLDLIPYTTNWNFEVCKRNATLTESTNYLTKMITQCCVSASHSYIGLVYALSETAMKDKSDDFEFIFNSMMQLIPSINAYINNIEKQMNVINSRNNTTRDTLQDGATILKQISE